MFWSKKTIYFVRHGESANNANNVRQGPLGGLSEKGQKQAEFVGERFTKYPIDIIFSSPYQRTQETAALINKSLHKDIELTQLLAERRNPSEIIGKPAESDAVKKIIDLIDRSFHNNNLRYSDEENFEDLKNRAKELLEFLAKRKESHILCVSHRIFLKMVISYVEQGKNLNSQDFVKLDFLNSMNNAGVTVCQYDPVLKWKGKFPWKTLVFNDYPRGI